MPGDSISNSGNLDDFISEDQLLQRIAEEADLSCRHVHQVGKNFQFLVEETIGNLTTLKNLRMAQLEQAKNLS